MEMPPKRALVGLSGRFLNFSPHRVVTTQSLLHYSSRCLTSCHKWTPLARQCSCYTGKFLPALKPENTGTEIRVGPLAPALNHKGPPAHMDEKLRVS